MKILVWQELCEPRLSERIPSPDATEHVLRELDAILRERERLRREIDAARERELQSHFDRRIGDRRTGRDRRDHEA